MPYGFKNKQTPLDRPSWRSYQAGLKKAAATKRLIKSIFKFTAVLPLIFSVTYGIIVGLGGSACHHATKKDNASSNVKIDTLHSHKKLIDKRQVQALLDGKTFLNLKDKSFDFDYNGHKFKAETSIDIPLQHFILKKINPSTSRYIGIVAMDPSTGKILSMAGYDKTNPTNNPCLDSKFPAASIFKIITAAAAIEKCDFKSNSKLAYNGNKYTLYKSQLKDLSNKYTNRITFRDSFAQSVNPVFGKIGALYLGKTTLEKYATAFGFNQSIDFEIPLPPSLVSLSDEPYQWAEIASGFNRETTISPLHGALLASSILNRGKLIEPTIIDQIIDEKGQIIYRSHLTTINQAITPEASKVINNLMGSTISSGTGKKAFKGYKRDRILSKLNIGGKTGSIYNKDHDARYDWFVGFANEKEGSEKIAISVVVAHEKYIGTRATLYARIAIKQYFCNYFAKNEAKIDKIDEVS